MNKKKSLLVTILGLVGLILFLSIGFLLTQSDIVVVNFGDHKVGISIADVTDKRPMGIMVGSAIDGFDFRSAYVYQDNLTIYNDIKSNTELERIVLPGSVVSCDSFRKDDDFPGYVFLISKQQDSFEFMCYILKPLDVEEIENKTDAKKPLVSLYWKKTIDSDEIISAEFRLGRSDGQNLVVCRSLDRQYLYYFDLQGNLVLKEDIGPKTVTGKINKNLASFDGRFVRVWGAIDKTYDLGTTKSTQGAFFPGLGESGVWLCDGDSIKSINVTTGKIEWEFKTPGIKKPLVYHLFYPYEKGTFRLVRLKDKKPKYSFSHISNKQYDFVYNVGGENFLAGFYESGKTRLFVIGPTSNGSEGLYKEFEIKPIEGKVEDIYWDGENYNNNLRMTTDKKIDKVATRDF